MSDTEITALKTQLEDALAFSEPDFIKGLRSDLTLRDRELRQAYIDLQDRKDRVTCLEGLLLKSGQESKMFEDKFRSYQKMVKTMTDKIDRLESQIEAMSN